jgi:serine palmitoyltransferase
MLVCFWRSEVDPLAEVSKGPGYATILKGFGAFYQRVMFALVNDCWSRPICSAPGVWVDVMRRTRKHALDLEFQMTGETVRCSNLGSYNYLGFATAAEGESEEVMRQCNDRMNVEVAKSISQYGAAMGSPAGDVGMTDLHRALEQKVASFVGKEDALIFGMGFATNTTNIPLFAGPGTLVVSDSLNHASLVLGCRASGATCEVFRHNDLEALENILRRAIRRGQDPTGKQYIPWKKILIVVEGIYSMEGEVLRLPEIVAIKKKYKAYLYVDEAHSIGSLGSRGRGVCDYWGVNPDDVDILMGTFTKSFSSVGGYISGSADVISSLRVTSLGMMYATSMPVPCVQQILCAMRVITGEDGTDEGVLRIRRLRENSIYFRRRLKDEGFVVAGDYDSPVIPMMIYNPFKFCGLSRALMEKNIAIVVVGYPATPLLLGRARFCMSSAHTIEQLERAVQNITQVGKSYHIDYNNNKNPWRFLQSI